MGGVALLDGPRLLAEEVLSEPPHRAATLIPSVARLLSAVGSDMSDVDAIALSIGPGSFTGVRIGLSTALGLCFGSERPIVPVPTLEALALQAPGFARVSPWLDARKGQVYAGLYATSGHDAAAPRPCSADCVGDPLEILSTLAGEESLALMGPGARLYQNEIESSLGDRACILGAPIGWPRPALTGALGARLLAEGKGRPASTIEPLYLRPADAEVTRSNARL